MSKTVKRIILIGLPVAAVCAAFVLLLVLVIAPNYKQSKAKRLIEEGFYAEAYDLLKGLNDRESAELAAQYCFRAQKSRLHDVTVGSTILFGTYEQDNDQSNGAEEIEWIVLDVQDGKALLLSRYGLEAKPYSTESKNATWETCTLRAWLNGPFLNTAFTDEEQARLRTVTVTADENPEYDTDPGGDTQDKVYLLSIDEAERCFASDDERKCYPTEKALTYHAWLLNEDCGGSGECHWWLRSPGDYPGRAALVSDDGSVLPDGWHVSSQDPAVRPVIMLQLSRQSMTE